MLSFFLITLASLIVAVLAFVRAVHQLGPRAGRWWFLCLLAMTAVVVNGWPLVRHVIVYFLTRKP